MSVQSAGANKEYVELLRKLALVKRKAKTALFLEGIFAGSLVLLPAFSCLFLLDNFVHLSAGLRVASVVVCIGGAMALFLKKAWSCFVRWTDERAAMRLEGVYPELDNRLINAVQLGRIAGGSESALLIHRLIEDALSASSRLNISRAARSKNLRRYALLLCGMFIVASFYPVLLPEGFTNAVERFLHPTSSIAALSQTGIYVNPGDITLGRGDALKVIAEVSGRLVRRAAIEVKTPDGIAGVDMSFDGMRFVFIRENVVSPLRYRIRAGDAKTRWFRVSVVEKPAVSAFDITYHYPEYTGLKARTVHSTSGEIKCIAGTRVVIGIEATKALKDAKMVLKDGRRLPLEIESPAAKCANCHISLKEGGAYRIHLTDYAGYTNEPSPLYAISVREDAPPRISLISPRGEIDARSKSPLPILYRASDDFGIARIIPQIAKEGFPIFDSCTTIDIKPAHKKIEDGYTLNLADKEPGDVLYFRIAALDNHPAPGTQQSFTSTLKIRITSKKKGENQSLDKETLKKLTHLKKKTEEFKEIQRKAIKTTRELLDKSPEAFTADDRLKLVELAALEDEWARFFEDAHSDLSKLPKLVSSDTALIEDTLEVFQEVKKVPDNLIPQPKTISVTQEQTGLELAEELTAHLEKWLPDTPDTIKWEMEEPSKDYEIPLAELPDELEDIIGDLIEREEDFTDEIEDVSSSWGDSIDKGAGWEASDGPISNYSAQGVTGNILPNSNEIGGRSGEGRSGRSHGEFVEATARGKGGRKTPTRLTNDPYEAGVVKDEMKQMTTGSTGGGKLSGAGGRGLRGPAPPEVRETLKRLSGKQADLITQAEKLHIAFEAHNLPTYNLRRAITGMHRIESDLRNYHYHNFLPEQHIVLQNLKAGKLLASRKVRLNRENGQRAKNSWKTLIPQSIKETFPKGYEEYIKLYYKKLAEY